MNTKLQKEWILVALFIVFDTGLFFAARHYLRLKNTPPIESLKIAGLTQDLTAVEELEKVALSGSWEALERARSEKANGFTRAKVRPSRGTALYFFPEILPERSLERDFANDELKPGLEALKTAYVQHEEKAAAQAFQKLQLRIENYELGASQNREELSTEAKAFLRTYQAFTTMK